MKNSEVYCLHEANGTLTGLLTHYTRSGDAVVFDWSQSLEETARRMKINKPNLKYRREEVTICGRTMVDHWFE